MPLSQFLHAGPTRVHAGEIGLIYGPNQGGKGRLSISKASAHGINENLWACLKIAVDALGLSLNINSIDTGQHVPTSRHYDGRAVDINHIGTAGADRGSLPQTTASNPHAVALLRFLVDNGFVAGHENGPHAAVLLGPIGSKWNATDVDHATHMHVSLPR
jgi:hypothetical protein